jgi:hypothetical protein
VWKLDGLLSYKYAKRLEMLDASSICGLEGTLGSTKDIGQSLEDSWLRVLGAHTTNKRKQKWGFGVCNNICGGL